MSIVLANVAARVEDNDVDEAREVGIYLNGAGAVVSRNRVRDGASHGIHAHDTLQAVISGNELSGNGAVAILVRSGLGTRVEDNDVRRNGYGVATVLGAAEPPVVVEGNRLEDQRFDGIYVVGGAPVLRGNRAVDNRGAGLRLLDYLPVSGPRVRATPRLEGNVLEGNRLGPRLTGDYQERD